MLASISVLTVSQLNKQVKGYLENEIGMVHVQGEISNLSKPSSGHFYFTLKDSSAQIRCVFFKNRHTPINASKLSDGQQIVASGRLSLYEARGDYQLIVEQLTDAGFGELHLRFEELKKKLLAEGLFNSERKRVLPSIPKSIGIITSTTGAAIRDMLSTLARRFPLAPVFIYPSEVQGATAASQLIKALQRVNSDNQCDVIILARGGGSIEDLWAFNDEQLARQIAASSIPVVSGVGHETDFTIADFVADYRAETPTAAAAAVTPDCEELMNLLNHAITRLHRAIDRLMQYINMRLKHIIEKISSPENAIATYWQSLDYLDRQLQFSISKIMRHKSHQLQLCNSLLSANNPKTQLVYTANQFNRIMVQLKQHICLTVSNYQHQLNNNLSTLHAVSPLATLDRGYSITTKNDKVIFSTQQLNPGDSIKVRLSKGSVTCEVEHIHD